MYGGQLIEYQVIEINENGSDVPGGFMSDVSYDGCSHTVSTHLVCSITEVLKLAW